MKNQTSTPPNPLTCAAKNGQFQQVFNSFDEDGDGKISPAELRVLMRIVGEDLSLEDAEELVRSADEDGDGLLDYNDFFRLVGDGGDDDKELREAFKMYEMEGEGCITPKSLKRMLSKLGTSQDMHECKAMICRFDLNGDGVLSFDEFRVMIQH